MVVHVCIVVINLFDVKQEMTFLSITYQYRCTHIVTDPFFYQDSPPANWMPSIYNGAIFMNIECLQEDLFHKISRELVDCKL